LAEGPTLGARALAEGLGTGLLVAVVVGSGIAAERLSPDDAGVQLLENSTATVLALAALILAFGAVSGAHLNPAVTLVERLRGTVDDRTAAAYAAAQLVGAGAGAIVANLMFELPAVDVSTHDRISSGTALGEVVATFGLVLVIRGVVHAGRASAVPIAVAGYLGAAYWFTSSTSFANPAVTVARTLSDTFAGIRPASVPGFLAAQVVGALLALAAGRVLFPDPEPALDEVLDA
jgi:glycerol uptake facilitator-like aquaporin